LTKPGDPCYTKVRKREEDFKMEIINLYPEALDWMSASDLRALLAEVGD